MENALTQIRKSNIKGAGNGVFALADIKKGDVVCYYKVFVTKSHIEKLRDASFAWEKNGKFAIGDYRKAEEYSTNVGQFINDASSLRLTDADFSELEGVPYIDSEWYRSKLEGYYLASVAGSNVQMDDAFIIHACKDIKKGDELYLHYGYKYWLNLSYFLILFPVSRMSCVLKSERLSLNDKDEIIFDGRVMPPEEFCDRLGLKGKAIANIEEMIESLLKRPATAFDIAISYIKITRGDACNPLTGYF